MPQNFSFLWHDYETFGADPRRDRPCQFAAIRTDADFNQIGEPEMFYSSPADDFLPHPMSVLITGITPQTARREGLTESDFAQRINKLMSQPNTCVLGYNTLRFDDEVSRHLFYRNFLDPYSREWQQGNSRWDLIDLVRALYALRPEGINWPLKEDGSPSFKLEDLTQANGIEHGAQAHDALADVRATIELAKLMKQAQPRLFDYLFNMRGKAKVAELLNLGAPKPLVHISSRFPAKQGCMAVVFPVAAHPTNPNAVIVYDLNQPINDLVNLSAEAIASRVFVSNADLEQQGLTRIPLKLVHLNRCPVLAPIATLQPAIAERHGLDLNLNEQHWRELSVHLTDQFKAKIQQVFNADLNSHASQDPDLMLYSGAFFSNQDKQLFQKILNTAPEELGELELHAQDSRIEEMLLRYRARNWPELLNSAERERWDEYRWHKFNSPQLSSLTLVGLQEELIRLSQTELSEEQMFLLQEVQLWVESILPLDLMH